MSDRKLYEQLGIRACQSVDSKLLVAQGAPVFLNGHEVLLERVQEEDRLGSVTVRTGISASQLHAIEVAAGSPIAQGLPIVRSGMASRGIPSHDWSPQRHRSKPHWRYGMVNPWGTECPQWRMTDAGELLFVADLGRTWNPVARTARDASFEELVPYAFAAMAGDAVLAGRDAQALERTAAYFRQLGCIDVDMLLARGTFDEQDLWVGEWPGLRLSAKVRGVLGEDMQTQSVIELRVSSTDDSDGIDAMPLREDYSLLPLGDVWKRLCKEGLGHVNDEHLETAGQEFWHVTTFWYQIPVEYEEISGLYRRKLIASALRCFVEGSRAFCGICHDLADAYRCIEGIFPGGTEAHLFVV